jgi:hypothetical protein
MSDWTATLLFIGWCVGYFTNVVIEAVLIVYRRRRIKRAQLHDATHSRQGVKP